MGGREGEEAANPAIGVIPPSMCVCVCVHSCGSVLLLSKVDSFGRC